jgi:Putative prokaryotic signal transducing protein
LARAKVDRFPVAGTASSRIDAELMAGFLRNEGIKAVVSADDEGGLSPVLQAGDRVRILVPRGQHGRAQRLIEKNNLSGS